MKKFVTLFLVVTLSLSTVAFASPSMIDNQDGTFTHERTGLVVNSSNEKVDQRAPATSMSAELTMLAANTSAVPAGGFTDVTPDSWAKSAIDAMTKAGVLQGYGNGLYGPKDTVSRAQFALMVIRAYGGNVDSLAAKQGNLADIVKSNGNYWANNVICAIQEFGLDANFHYDNVYRVTDYDHPFDRYAAEPVLCLDEFRSSLMIGEMLNYLDGYPLSLPARYANRVACFETVYIISNIELGQQYPNVQESEPATWRAFLRRIHNVIEYRKSGPPVDYGNATDYIYPPPPPVPDWVLEAENSTQEIIPF